MRNLALVTAAVLVISTTGIAFAGPISSPGLSGAASSPIVLAQTKASEPKKSEPLKQKVKRAWRNLTGYKFDVACPALIPLSHSTCTETGKNRDAARSKCQAANPFCAINSQG